MMTGATTPENNQSNSNGRGGRRKGAGRKVGSVSARSRKFADAAVESGELLPLEYMLAVLRDETRDYADRMDAAKSAAPYVHAKLAAVQHTGPDGGPVAFTLSPEDMAL
jgi:hypothetical protein